MAERAPYALEDWLQGLEDDYRAQQQEYANAFADLRAQEEADQAQALADFLSRGLPEPDFHRSATASSAAEDFRAYAREVQRERLQMKADIATSYANAAGDLRDASERSTQDYLQQKGTVTKLLSQGGLSSIEHLVPKDDSLRMDIERMDVPQPDGSVVPSYVQKQKQVRDEDVRPTELANFLGIPEDVVRTQLLQEKIGSPDVTPEAIQKRNLADIGQSIALSKEIVQNPWIAQAFEGADPESVGGRALVYADALKTALASVAGEKLDRANAKLVQSRVLQRISDLRTQEGRAPSAEEVTAWTKENWGEILALQKISPQIRTALTTPPTPRPSGLLGATLGAAPSLAEDVGLGAASPASQQALGLAAQQAAAPPEAPRLPVGQGTPSPLEELMRGAVRGGQAYQEPAPADDFLSPTGVPYPHERPYAEQFRALDELLNLIPKDPRVQNELLQLFGLR